MTDIVERLRDFRRRAGPGYEAWLEQLRRAAADEIERLRSASEWGDISNAPSDGREVLIWGGRYEAVKSAGADGDWWRWERKSGNNSVPTHWQPLPAPPQRNEVTKLNLEEPRG